MLKIALKPHAAPSTNAASLKSQLMVQGRIVVSRFDSEHDVLTLANATPCGLAAYFYLEDVARVWRAADAPQSGIVGIDEVTLAAG